MAIVPKTVTQLLKEGHMIEAGVEANAHFPDTEYEQAGTVIINDAQLLYSEAYIIMKVQPPQRKEVEMTKVSSTYTGFLTSILILLSSILYRGLKS